MESAALPDQTPKGIDLSVLVLGDVQVDTVIARLPFEPASSTVDVAEHNWQQQPQYAVFRRPGGAWLLCEVIQAAVGPEVADAPKITVHTAGAEEGKALCAQPVPKCPLSVATLKPFPKEVSSKKPRPEGPVAYRIPEKAMIGWLRHEPYADRSKEYADAMLERLEKLGRVQPRLQPDLLVLLDHNHGFRDIDKDVSLKPFLPEGLYPGPTDLRRGVILLHSDAPLARGPLWECLYGTDEPYLDRLVVVVNAEDLRNWGVTLVEDISLEQTIADFMYNVERTGPNGPLYKLAQCRCVIVKSPLGVIIHSRHPVGGAPRVNSSFLPFAVGGPTSDPKQYGTMVGYSIILVAALAKGICWALSKAAADSAEFERNLDAGIRSGAHLGLVLCEEHLRKGFIETEPGKLPDNLESLRPYADLFERSRLKLARDDKEPDTTKPPGVDGAGKAEEWHDDYRIASVDFEAKTLGGMQAWSRVELLPGKPDWKTVEAAAMDVVMNGLKSVVKKVTSIDPDPPHEPDWNLPRRLHFPHAKIGELSLVDRAEIDSISHVQKLVLKYFADDNWKTPLSIAVFGPPGSGKSFTVKQIIQTAAGDDGPELEFNLSQFQSLGDLSHAFHVVQDRHLATRKPPLVFFDEFDTSLGDEEFGWLKYFLAPMQDGKFRAEQNTYRVGRAVFVFAGGIFHSFQSFYGSQRDEKQFRDAKGPDFVSRLRGHLNILGINPENGGEVDERLMFRRAILLRSFLERICPTIVDEYTQTANIDRAVIGAFLRTRRYEHGARSMEAIVQMAAISISRRKFQRSSVPAATQIGMHVDAEEFERHLRDPDFEGSLK